MCVHGQMGEANGEDEVAAEAEEDGWMDEL